MCSLGAGREAKELRGSCDFPLGPASQKFQPKRTPKQGGKWDLYHTPPAPCRGKEGNGDLILGRTLNRQYVDKAMSCEGKCERGREGGGGGDERDVGKLAYCKLAVV